MSEERPAHDAITWEDADPDQGGLGAFEILYEGSPLFHVPLVEEAVGGPIEDNHVFFRPAHLFSCDLGGERRLLRVSVGYHLSYYLRSIHAGLDSDMPHLRDECARVLRTLRTAEGVLFEAETTEQELWRSLKKLRMIEEALQIERRRLADLPFVFLLPQGDPGTARVYPSGEEIVFKRLSDDALRASLQMPVCAHVPVYPRERGYLEGLATLARMVATRRGLPVSRA